MFRVVSCGVISFFFFSFFGSAFCALAAAPAAPVESGFEAIAARVLEFAAKHDRLPIGLAEANDRAIPESVHCAYGVELHSRGGPPSKKAAECRRIQLYWSESKAFDESAVLFESRELVNGKWSPDSYAGSHQATSAALFRFAEELAGEAGSRRAGLTRKTLEEVAAFGRKDSWDEPIEVRLVVAIYRGKRFKEKSGAVQDEERDGAMRAYAITDSRGIWIASSDVAAHRLVGAAGTLRIKIESTDHLVESIRGLRIAGSSEFGYIRSEPIADDGIADFGSVAPGTWYLGVGEADSQHRWGSFYRFATRVDAGESRSLDLELPIVRVDGSVADPAARYARANSLNKDELDGSRFLVQTVPEIVAPVSNDGKFQFRLVTGKWQISIQDSHHDVASRDIDTTALGGNKLIFR